MDYIRADALIARLKKAKSRSEAADLIKRGLVTVDGKPVAKSASLVPVDCHIVIHEPRKFVSRGGDKLQGALSDMDVDVSSKIVIDAGASTGGFTDCLLQNGAKRIYAVDVGYGQLDWKIRNDPRVVVMERTNIRHVTPQDIPEKCHLAVLDLSFISLKHVLPSVAVLLTHTGSMITLVKPQFEVGKDLPGFKGVVRDKNIHRRVLDDIIVYMDHNAWTVCDIVASRLMGPKGNKEFFILMTKDPEARAVDLHDRIKLAVERSI
ncbi:TlyA family RNA methyltransferase [bacterium]|nr:TlyA family RNA methyltransferase [candidate division CSSED10-310 bacterium]